VNDVDALIGWLLEAPRGSCPVEDCGATAVLSAISGAEITADLHLRGPRTLTVREQQRLQTLGVTVGYERRGTLYAGNVPAAAITAVLLPHRIPGIALRALGIDASGAALGDGGVPLGRALAGLGVRREPLEVLPTPGQRDAGGREQVIWSAARLWLRSPVALVTECFYRQFLDAYPGPWTVPFPGPRSAL
jgi:hypothetical protein